MLKEKKRRLQKKFKKEKKSDEQKESSNAPFYLQYYLKHKNDYYNPPIKIKKRNQNKFKNNSILNIANNKNNKKGIISVDNIELEKKNATNDKNNKKVLEKTKKTMIYNYEEIPKDMMRLSKVYQENKNGIGQYCSFSSILD